MIYNLILVLAMYFHCISFSSYLDLLSCLLPLGLAFGSMCVMAPGPHRSRSPRRSVPEEVHGLVIRLPYDPLNPYDPPLTVYTEHRFTDLPHLPSQPPTSPISSRDFSSRSRSPVPPILQTKSLPPLRRRRRHLREPAVEAPIIFTPSVTLEEAPHSEQPPSSSATHPALSGSSKLSQTCGDHTKSKTGTFQTGYHQGFSSPFESYNFRNSREILPGFLQANSQG